MPRKPLIVYFILTILTIKCITYLSLTIIEYDTIKYVLFNNITMKLSDSPATVLLDGLYQQTLTLIIFFGLVTFIPSVLMLIAYFISKKIITLTAVIIHITVIIIFLFAFFINPSRNIIFFAIATMDTVLLILIMQKRARVFFF